MGARAEPVTAAPRPNRHAWIGYALAAASLVWVFHDVSFRDFWPQIRGLSPAWIGAAILIDVLAYLTQGWRWGRLLSAVGRVGALEASKAVYAGLYLNEVLPLRLGEILRIHLIARRLGGRYAAVASSVFVERFIDAVWLSAAFGVVVLVTPLPRYLVDAEELLAALAFVALAVIVSFAAYSRNQVERGRPPSRHWIVRVFRPLGESLALIGRSRVIVPAFALSVGVLAFQALAFYFVAVSYGLPLKFWQTIAAFLVQHIGNAVPGGPGNLGTYQLFTVLGLTLFGVDKASATGFSIVVFLVLTIPLWAIGSICFARSGLELGSIRSELAAWRG